MTHERKSPSLQLSRRTLIAAAGASLAAIPLAGNAAPHLQLDGVYREPWLIKTSGALNTDFAEAVRSARNFAMLWEMRGCPWCKLLHVENFAREDITSYLQANYSLLQLNLRGKQQITDFDGEKLTEEDLAYKYGINSTPTFQFFKPADAFKGEELGRAGYLKPEEFLTLLRFIREKGYENGSYEEWVQRHKNPV
ncbi:MAG: thioredoxin family protein [Rhodomicrobium sp.]